MKRHLLLVLLALLSFNGHTTINSTDLDQVNLAIKDFLHGEATMEGVYQVYCLDSEKLSDVLPKKLFLYETNLCNSGFHPVLFFFGKQKKLSTVTPLGRFVVAEKYNESVLLVFSVKREGLDEVFSYVPQIKVNSLAAYLFAIPYGGLNKHVSYINHSDGSFVARSFNKRKSQIVANWTSGGRSLNDARHFLQLLPHFNRRVIAKNNFTYNCFTFQWNLKEDDIQVADLSFTLFDDFLGPEFSGIYDDARTIEESHLGAFATSNHWKMSAPHSCR